MWNTFLLHAPHLIRDTTVADSYCQWPPVETKMRRSFLKNVCKRRGLDGGHRSGHLVVFYKVFYGDLDSGIKFCKVIYRVIDSDRVGVL